MLCIFYLGIHDPSSYIVVIFCLLFAGHQVEKCKLNGEYGRYCKQCGEFTFQPDQNKYGDQCRIRYVLQSVLTVSPVFTVR